MQLDMLQRHVRVVSLAELLDDASATEERLVAITFDDAYLGAVTAGVKELRARGLPATMFVTPKFLGGRAFWWDALASRRGLETEVRTHCLDDCAGDDLAVRTWATSVGYPITEPASFALTATELQLDSALDYPRLSLASHTWSHPNLTRISDAQLTFELTRSLSWLMDRYGSRVGSWIAYPYGLTDSNVERFALSAGYSACFRVNGGWWPRLAPRQSSLPRLNVSAGLSIDGFSLRLAGLFCPKG